MAAVSSARGPGGPAGIVVDVVEVDVVEVDVVVDDAIVVLVVDGGVEVVVVVALRSVVVVGTRVVGAVVGQGFGRGAGIGGTHAETSNANTANAATETNCFLRRATPMVPS